MKPGIPWSVKGVEPELREIAKSAARRQGMTLGEWLNSAINEQAEGAAPIAEAEAAPPRAPRKNLISTHPIERAATKLEDIAEQLSKLAARESESAYRPPHNVEDQVAYAKVLSRVESNERQTVEAFSAVNDRLATISRQIRTAQQPAAAAKAEDQPSYQALEKAVRNIVEHLEVSDKRTRENMKALQERMGDMASRVATSSSEQVLRQAPAFSQLESRLSDLARRMDQPQQQQALMAVQLRHELDQLAGRIDTVHQTAEALAAKAQTQAVQAAQGELRAIEQRITSVLNEARQSIAADHMGPAEMQRFRQQIDQLNERIDDSSRHAASDRDVSALKVAVEQLSARVAQGQDPRPLADLDRRLLDIASKLERTEAATRDLPQVNELERRFAELDQRLTQTLSSPTSSSADQLAQKLGEVDERLSRTEHQLSHLETIERAITQLYDTMEQNRKSAHEAAHDAAARMAEQLAAQPQAAAAAPLSLANVPEIIALEDGLKAVREAAQNADTRNQETLEAVHETLEQIVGKLTELETAAIGQRLAQAVAPAAEEPAMPVFSARPPAPEAVAAPVDAHPNPFAPAPTPVAAEPFAAAPPPPRNFMDSIFADVAQAPGEPAQPGNPFLDAAGPAEDGTAPTPEGGIGDLVAAARRLHQASHGQAAALGSISPGSKAKPEKKKAKGFSLPFLKSGASGKAEAKAKLKDPSTLLTPANGNAAGSRRRLVILGFALLVVGTFAVSNTLGKLRHAAPAPTPAVTQQQDGAAAPVAPDATSATPAAPGQPEPAPIVAPEGQNKASSNQQGDASDAMPADPILTGAVSPAQAAPVAAAVPAPVATPASVALEAAVGPAKLRHAAETGDAAAQFIIASHYLNGDTVQVDYAKAAYWYGKASASGLAPAQYRLATLYERGKGVDKNLSAALAWYERAAALGNVKAMHNAAVIAAGNDAGAPDYAKAYKWFSLAAGHGVKDSQFNLAVLIERGLGTKQDQTEALFWYMAAAQQDDADAKARVEAMAKTLSPATVEAAKARLKAWVPDKAPEAANTVAANDAQWNPSGQAAQATPTNINDQAKNLLEKMGYRVGEKDGTLDAATANAIRLFQMKQGLKVNGQISPDLIAAMQSKVG
ncbi:MAG: SEL1-like repeat protein [Alphaproteobacteria bacterium]|nr:SEL1-like repeat protein [Alphaproteobacteria bacterium]